MADSTISALTAATTLQDADLGVFVQSGTTKKATLSQILAKALPLAGGTMTGALGTLGVNVIGQVSVANNATDATNKIGRFVVPHYTNAEEPLVAVTVTSGVGFASIAVGGGSASNNAATIGQLNAAPNVTTLNGTPMLRWTTAGVRIQSGATAAASSLFHVSATGNANAFRVDDTTGNVAFGGVPISGLTSSYTTVYVSRTSATTAVGIRLNNTQAAAAGVGSELGIEAGNVQQAVAIGAWDGAATTDAYMAFGTRGSNTVAERMRITSAGNVLVGTDTDLASSILTMGSTTKGFLPPRMTTTQRDDIGSTATGLVVYNTTTDKLNVYTGSAWEAVTSA